MLSKDQLLWNAKNTELKVSSKAVRTRLIMAYCPICMKKHRVRLLAWTGDNNHRKFGIEFMARCVYKHSMDINPIFLVQFGQWTNKNVAVEGMQMTFKGDNEAREQVTKEVPVVDQTSYHAELEEMERRKNGKTTK